MAIKQYSLAKDGARQLAPGFKVREFRCRDGSDVVMIDDAQTYFEQADACDLSNIPKSILEE